MWLVRVALISLLGLSWSRGAQIVVTTSEDELDDPSGVEVSLREAIRDAAAGDEILFDQETLSGATIVLDLGELVIGKTLGINASSLAEPVTIDGQQIWRVLKVLTGTDVVVRGVVISGGRAIGEGGDGGGVLSFGNLTLVDCKVSDNQSRDGGPGQQGSNGGGISSRQGSLVLNRCTILNNRSGGGGNGSIGGSGGSGGGVFCMGELSVYNSIFSGNRAGDGRGVISGLGADGGSGGAIYAIGTAILENCHIHDNQAGAGGDAFDNGHPVIAGWGGPGGGIRIVTNSKTVSVVRGCTIENNRTGLGGRGAGGGERGDGGGIAHAGSTGLVIENTTIYRNSAAEPECDRGVVQGKGGGLYSTGGTPVIMNSTIVDNEAGFGGGIYVRSSFELLNTIVARNHICYTPVSGTEMSGTLIDGSGHNFVSGDPQLAPIGFYGGSTPTMPPLPASPVIDAGMTVVDYTVDQRGFHRSVKPGYDIGAVEFIDADEFAEIWDSDLDRDGISYGVEQALGRDPLYAESAAAAPLDYDIDPSGNQTLSFNLGNRFFEGTHWIIRQSNDLENFTEIYRFDGVDETHAKGVSSVRDGDRVQVSLPRFEADRVYFQFVSPLPVSPPSKK